MNKVFKLLFSSFFLIISVTNVFSNEKEKLKIGLLIPLTGGKSSAAQTGKVVTSNNICKGLIF